MINHRLFSRLQKVFLFKSTTATKHPIMSEQDKRLLDISPSTLKYMARVYGSPKSAHFKVYIAFF